MDESGVDDEFRCITTNGSGGWRCKEKALPGKTQCEKHHVYDIDRTKMKKESSSDEKKVTKGKGEECLQNGVVVDDGTFGGIFGGDEVNGGANIDVGCESFNLWQQDGQQVGVFGQGSGNLGQFLGDGVEFVGGFVEDRNKVNGGLGQPWSSVGVFGNAGGVSGVGKEDNGNVLMVFVEMVHLVFLLKELEGWLVVKLVLGICMIVVFKHFLVKVGFVMM
jgi:lysine-specific demethylase 3